MKPLDYYQNNLDATLELCSAKADILFRTFWGPVTPQLPGSILQFHPNVTVICDMDASVSLPL